MTDNNEDETATVDRGAYEASASTIPGNWPPSAPGSTESRPCSFLGARTASETGNRGFEIQQRPADTPLLQDERFLFLASSSMRGGSLLLLLTALKTTSQRHEKGYSAA